MKISIFVIIIAIVISVVYIIIQPYSNTIWVCPAKSYTNAESEDFVYKLNNKTILQTGNENIFEVTIDKENLFTKIKKDFQIFKELENEILFISNNEIYSIKKLKKNIFTTTYSLFSNHFICIHGEQTYYIPFPVYLINDQNKEIPRIESDFTISGNIDEVKTFYKYYNNVEINENKITYCGIDLIIENQTVKIIV